MMKKLLCLTVNFIFLNLSSQKDFSTQLAFGPNYYFNNLEIFKDNLDPINYSFYGKIMWNTRYRLSFGIESGYIRLYRLNDFSAGAKSEIHMTAIPVHAAIEMKLNKQFYANFSFGPSFIRNKITSTKGEQITHTFSLSDVSFGLGYRHQFKNEMFVGVETKFFYSSKSEDRNIAVPVFVGLNF